MRIYHILILILTELLMFHQVFCQTLSHSRNPYHLPLIQTAEEYDKLVKQYPDQKLINLEKAIPGIKLDIRYATKNNFTHEVIYSLPRAFLRKPVALALKKVQDSLAYYHLGLKIYDAYRPYSATLRFMEVYPDTNFVANPRFGSRHNRGCAVDLTLVDKNTGDEIPMPSDFDDFSEKALPDNPNFPDTVIANRSLLFGIMLTFGFTHYKSEWWHFDFKGWNHYPLMDIDFPEIEKQKD